MKRCIEIVRRQAIMALLAVTALMISTTVAPFTSETANGQAPIVRATDIPAIDIPATGTPAARDPAANTQPANRQPSNLQPGETPADRPSPNPHEAQTSDGEDLGRTSTGRVGDHPLRDIAERMVEAQGRLRNHDTSSQTLTVQRQIVDGLTQLIERQQQQQSSSQQSAAQRRAAPPGTSAGDRPGSTGGQGTRLDSDHGERGSNPLFRQLWGHLPDEVRRQVETPLHEKFLPQYDELIQAYFKRLANERPE